MMDPVLVSTVMLQAFLTSMTRKEQLPFSVAYGAGLVTSSAIQRA